jgi:hypothetical protein
MTLLSNLQFLEHNALDDAYAHSIDDLLVVIESDLASGLANRTEAMEYIRDGLARRRLVYEMILDAIDEPVHDPKQ